MTGGPVKVLVWAVGAVAAAAVASPAQAVTGHELLRQCEALERGATVSGETVRLPKSQEAAVCWFYMGAVQDIAATVEEEGGSSVIGSCVPAETTRMELVRAFTKYARAHRSDLNLRATALIIPALSNAFPCPMPGRIEAGPPKTGVVERASLKSSILTFARHSRSVLEGPQLS